MRDYSIKKILVPVDLSQTSLNALETAVFLSKKFKATLQILQIDERMPGQTADHATSFRTYPETFNALTVAIQHISDIKPQLLKKEGYVTESILETAITEKTDLIIMGTHGASGFRDGFIGSNCYGVMKYGATHILAIPGVHKINLFGNVLFPIRPITNALLPYKLVSGFLAEDPTLNILGLSNSSAERETTVLKKLTEEIKSELDTYKVKAISLWGKGISGSADVLHFVQIHSPDLVVLTSFLDGIFKSNYIGPHTQKIIHSCRVPLLCIK